MIVGLELIEDNLDELLKRFKMLKEAQVEVGVFTAGAHYSGFTYPNLLKYLSDGDPDNNMAPRPVLDIAMAFNFQKGLKDNKKYLKKFLSKINISKTDAELKQYLDNLGEYYSAAAKNIFGNGNILAPNTDWTEKRKGFNAPLVDTSELKNAIGYQVTI